MNGKWVWVILAVAAIIYLDGSEPDPTGQEYTAEETSEALKLIVPDAFTDKVVVKVLCAKIDSVSANLLITEVDSARANMFIAEIDSIPAYGLYLSDGNKVYILDPEKKPEFSRDTIYEFIVVSEGGILILEPEDMEARKSCKDDPPTLLLPKLKKESPPVHFTTGGFCIYGGPSSGLSYPQAIKQSHIMA